MQKFNRRSFLRMMAGVTGALVAAPVVGSNYSELRPSPDPKFYSLPSALPEPKLGVINVIQGYGVVPPSELADGHIIFAPILEGHIGPGPHILAFSTDVRNPYATPLEATLRLRGRDILTQVIPPFTTASIQTQHMYEVGGEDSHLLSTFELMLVSRNGLKGENGQDDSEEWNAGLYEDDYEDYV